ncbi:SDR family NAD(P)-dependent oxidoreductase [Paraburkholderia sp. CNPSo 3076]|uniref:SDR family NAD(P)-dependent oxidoreductase n=1 Tax=Paraburkholderia sp. CNPSo 3076 TaxID=2940936 RepID=UPI002253029D|nr:SDR family oxidoreductase [Paraburkholderia sp. CNPSo 3076]MCX5540429.1 SDR family NAD(P)-dependent oxidoreductase [Paraburkholderia sp. CNPSo 3076]
MNTKSWLDLEEKVCVVTGAAGGIGAQIALALAREGAHVTLLDRDSAACAVIAGRIVSEGGYAIVIDCDVADKTSVVEAARESERALGRCNVLVNNAAITLRGPLLELDVDHWNRVLAVNLTGALLCAQAFGQQMRALGSGSMIHVASIAASSPIPLGGAYSASKAALAMLAQQLAVELADDGVRSNVVSPGLVRTPLSARYYEDPAMLRARTKMVPSRRIADPQDIADAVLFLASERSGYVNGQELLVDGALGRNVMALVPRPQ